MLQYCLLDGLRVEHQDEGLPLVNIAGSPPWSRIDHRRAASVEDEWRMALKGGALQRLEARGERESATETGRQIAVEVVRPVPAVDPSRRSMLGAVDLKRRLLDARITQRTQRNHRLRKMRPGLE